jgi:hypothetical protein
MSKREIHVEIAMIRRELALELDAQAAHYLRAAERLRKGDEGAVNFSGETTDSRTAKINRLSIELGVLCSVRDGRFSCD